MDPEFIIFPFGMLGFFGAFGLLGYAFVRSGKRLPEETGRAPQTERRTSGRIGMLRFRGPFIRFAVYDDMVIVSSMMGTYRIDSDTLQEVGVERVFFNQYVRIVTNDPNNGLVTIRLNLAGPERVVEMLERQFLNV